MQSRLWLTLAVFFAILSWAGFRIATTHPTSDEPPVIPVARPRPAPPRQDERPSIAATDFRFADAALHSEFLRFDEAVTRMPDLGWTETAGERYAPDRGNSTTWKKLWHGSGRVVWIKTVTLAPSQECYRFEFSAATYSREEWGASLHYQHGTAPSTSPREFFLLITPPRSLVGIGSSDRRSFSVTPEDVRFSAQFEKATREFDVWVSRPRRKGGPHRKEIASYLESAESFRAAARQETLRFKTDGEQTLARGVGIVEWVSAPPNVRVPGDKIPLRDQVVGEEVRAEALKLFRAEMETRLEWIDTHFAEMYAAVLDVFPGVRELLLP